VDAEYPARRAHVAELLGQAEQPQPEPYRTSSLTTAPFLLLIA